LNAAIIKVSELTKDYPGGEKGAAPAVMDVNFDVSAGEFISMLGPSGCGKSTVLNCIAGLVAPTSGYVEVDGKRVNSPSTSLGVAFQEPLLMDWRTSLDNVMLQFEMRGKTTYAQTQEALRLLASVGLSGFENAYPWQLSGGMKQRVALCRAMVHGPPVLLLDEPFGALDVFTRDQLNLDISRLARSEKKTVVLVTHSVPEAVFLSDRILVMASRPGRVVEDIRVELDDRASLDIRGNAAFARYERDLYALFEAEGVAGQNATGGR
jgi:NitT/TauT family transport system ATP-binding protein